MKVMQPKQIQEWLRAMPFLCAGLTAWLIALLGVSGKRAGQRQLLHSSRDFVERVWSKGETSSWYRRKSSWLMKNGAAFHFFAGINPFSFLALKTALAFLGFPVLAVMGSVCGIGSMAVLFFLPDILAGCLNSRDNRALLPEMKVMYQALEMQIQAGIHVTQALAECYGFIRHPRLQKALLDLAGDLVLHGDLYEALDAFAGKFDNRHIDALCIIILQATESGQAVELLRDLGEQIKDLEALALAGKKEALDRSITFYQLGILAAVLCVVIYACVTQILLSAVRL